LKGISNDDTIAVWFAFVAVGYWYGIFPWKFIAVPSLHYPFEL